VPHTTTRELYLRELPAEGGRRGRVVYIPWDIDRTFWDVLSVDHGQLLRNAIGWATNEPQPVEVEGPGFLDVTAWRQRDSMTVHLVNLTNPMMMKGPLREPIPIGPLRARIRLPARMRASKVHLLTAGTPARVEQGSGSGGGAGVITVTVPSVEVHEVIAVDFA
jgi:hypothetical protein